MAKGYYGNAEAVVFNQAPFFNFFQQQQQQKKIENQALDKQITDDLAKLTPTGMRQQDVDSFLKNYQNLKNLSIQYKDAIRNPAKNPKTWQEFQNEKNKLVGLIAESKAAKENTKALYDFRAKNLDKLDDDAFKQAMTLYNAPIGTPEHEQAKTFDQSQLIFKAPKMDLVKLYTPINQLKPEEVQEVEQLPSGQIRKVKSKQVSPGAVAQYMTMAYDTDLLNSRKGFDDMFNNTPPDQVAALETYAQKYYDPEFKITSPKDLAVASGLYGRVNKSVVEDLGGTDLSRREDFARAQQQRSFAHQDAMDARRAARAAAKKEMDDYVWESDIATALKNKDTENIKRLATRLESSTPGVEYNYIKEGETDTKWLNFYKGRLKKYGVDGKSKNLTDKDFKAGILLINIPRTNKDGSPIIDKATNDAERDYMAVSANDKYIENRLNKLKNYAGDTKKYSKDKLFEQPPAFEENEFAPINDEDEEEQ
jgi:hypothetical protein